MVLHPSVTAEACRLRAHLAPAQIQYQDVSFRYILESKSAATQGQATLLKSEFNSDYRSFR